MRGATGPKVTSELVLPCSSTATTPRWYDVPSINGLDGVSTVVPFMRAEVMLTSIGGVSPLSKVITGLIPSVELNA